MNAQLPAHLQGRQQRNLTDSAFSGMAGALPPHISIRSNRFTLVGADGARQTLESIHMHVCFVDVSEVIQKLYYEHDYQEGNDDPPTCWSANGVVPSREAVTRQARTCAECQWNIRGSATSALSGKAIKACRDEKWTAVTLAQVQTNPQGQAVSVQPLYPDVLWQFRITPGSFKNWRSFVERCKSQGVDMSLLLTRVGFEADKNGVLTFQPVTWIDAALADIRDKAWAGKATDILVGRNDQAPALEAPAPAITPQPAVQMQPVLTPAPTAAPTASTTEAPKRQRGRPARTNGGQAAQGTAPVAPFRPEAQQAAQPVPASQPAPPWEPGPAPAPNFGIQQPAAAPAGLDTALDSFFGPVK